MYEWLKDYQQMKDNLDYLEYKLILSERELARWEDSDDLGDIKLEAGSKASNLENIIASLKEEIEYKTIILNNTIEVVSKFTGLNNQILRMKYIEGMTLYDIALQLNYSVGYIQQRHGEVMRTLKVIDEIE